MRRLPRPWLLRYGAAALPIALMVLYAKVRWLQISAFRIVARSLGLAGLADLTVGDKLSFLRGDLLVGTIGFALVLTAVATLTRPRWRVALTIALVTMVAMAFYLQVRAQATVGTFLHIRLFISAARFANERPDLAVTYLPYEGLAKLAFAILAAAATAVWAGRRDPDRPGAKPAGRLERLGTMGIAAAVLVATAATWTPRVRATPMHGSMLVQAISTYWGHGTSGDAEFTNLPPAELARAYRELTDVAASPVDSTRWGRARGFDVLIFMMETVPNACVDFTGDLSAYPTAQRLRRNAIIAARHHAVYPYSSLSNFSTLSSWYPPEFARSYMQRHEHERIPSMLWDLRALGYRTALFEPFPALFEDDPLMYRLLGMEEQVVPGTPPISGRFVWQEIVRQDSVAAARLLAHLQEWLSTDQRYAVVYAPQISHAPWRDPVPGRDTTDLIARCRSLVAVQDSALGRLVGLVDRHGRLGRTIIVLTADHGVRTKEEDPRFEPGVLDDYSFHVPLMIAAPGILDSTETIDAVSSGVDIAPTLLDLLGVERDRDLEQGNALWDPHLGRRTTFVLAQQLFGVNGFHLHGRFYQWNSMTGAVCRSTGRLACGAQGLVGGDSGSAVVRRLIRFTALQRTWLERNLLPAQ